VCAKIWEANLRAKNWRHKTRKNEGFLKFKVGVPPNHPSQTILVLKPMVLDGSGDPPFLRNPQMAPCLEQKVIGLGEAVTCSVRVLLIGEISIMQISGQIQSMIPTT
jgi:hypothetical protein